jgi:8-oxo-dGTP pyrophosphatase MutT (NUDIX family)
MSKFATSRPYAASLVMFKRDGKIAFVLRSNTEWMDGHYGFVGGKVEEGESFIECAIREAKEEAGVVVRAEQLKPVIINHRKTPDETLSWVDVFFEATEWEGEVVNAEPDRHGAVEWLDPKDLPDNVIPLISFVLNEAKAGKFYTEYGWDQPEA